MRRISSIFLVVVLVTAWPVSAKGPLLASAAIATTHPLATAAGEEMLKPA